MAKSSRTAGINAFARERREDSLKRLREAADAVFVEFGYVASSVDQIATRAGISRQTFYRLFDGKVALGMDFFERHSGRAEQTWLAIRDRDFNDPKVVRDWARALVKIYTENFSRIRVFHEMGHETALVTRVNTVAQRIIVQLGEKIPAFSGVFRDDPSPDLGRARPLIFFQQMVSLLNSSSSEYFSVSPEVLIEIMTENFLRFVRS